MFLFINERGEKLIETGLSVKMITLFIL